MMQKIPRCASRKVDQFPLISAGFPYLHLRKVTIHVTDQGLRLRLLSVEKVSWKRLCRKLGSSRDSRRVPILGGQWRTVMILGGK